MEKGVETKYEKSSIENMAKTLSAIAKHLTDEDKIQIIHDHYTRLNDKNSLNKLRLYKPEKPEKKRELVNDFDTIILSPYSTYVGCLLDDFKKANPTQEMTAKLLEFHHNLHPKQTKAYQPHAVLLDKLFKAAALCQHLGLHRRPRNLYRYQFVVAGLIFLLATRNCRVDIAKTALEDSPKENVVLREDGIFIKKCKKTREKNVLLGFEDERLMDAVKTLADFRKAEREKYLFLHEGKASRVKFEQEDWDPEKWFSDAFTKNMRRLNIGDNIYMGIFRLAYGIKLAQEHDGTLASQERICDAMGHSWDTHMRWYSLKRLEAIENGEDVEMEEAE
ncbi:hypothetical protein HK104_004627 [Borealophlyctis nickersoniae]|nr:hypothetical protein HK104_004627 [Borealophlyctis nickersoniae]